MLEIMRESGDYADFRIEKRKGNIVRVITEQSQLVVLTPTFEDVKLK